MQFFVAKSKKTTSCDDIFTQFRNYICVYLVRQQ